MVLVCNGFIGVITTSTIDISLSQNLPHRILFKMLNYKMICINRLILVNFDFTIYLNIDLAFLKVKVLWKLKFMEYHVMYVIYIC